MPGALGSAVSDFEIQLKTMNRELFTFIAWDPRGYGKSIPPERDWPLNFLERDGEDAVRLMEVMILEANIIMQHVIFLGH